MSLGEMDLAFGGAVGIQLGIVVLLVLSSRLLPRFTAHAAATSVVEGELHGPMP